MIRFFIQHYAVAYVDFSFLAAVIDVAFLGEGMKFSYVLYATQVQLEQQNNQWY